MAGIPRPELIFVAGPQQGQRTVLMGNTALVGRAPSAEIQIREQYVSRRQMQFTLTRDGWVIQNLAGSPMRVNGRKYGGKKRILLATGDVIALGLSTEMLFVAPDDDPEEALRAHREAHGAPAPPGAAPPVAAPAAQAAGPPPEPPGRRGRHARGEGPAKPAERPADAEDEDRRRKRRKYIIFFAVDLVIVVVLIVWFGGSGGSGNSASLSERPPFLTDDEVIKALRGELDLGTNPRKAQKKLAEAKYYYEVKRNFEDGDLYLAVKRFKEYSAYIGQQRIPVEHRKMYHEALTKLIAQVIEQYHRAYNLEQQRNWPEAQREYRRLLLMVPEETDSAGASRDENVYKVIVLNARRHLAYINRKITEREAG